MKALRFGLLFLISMASVAAAEHAHDHKRQKSLSAHQGEVTLWSYQFAQDIGVPYFHPVTTSGGELLTGFAPADHRWHRGIWFSWKFLNGVNYWEWKDRKTPILEGQTETVGKEVFQKVESGVSIVTQLRYSHESKLVLEEKREITIESPRPDGSYAMDWCMTFTAAGQDVEFQRTPPIEQSWGGYGGLSYRTSSELKEHRVINSEGQKGKEGHGKPARWMDFSGKLPSGQIAGVTMFDHPGNPRHPTPWYVSTGKMGYFNPALLFHEPLSLPDGESVTLRYRMLIHPGQLETPGLEREYLAFVSQNDPDIGTLPH